MRRHVWTTLRNRERVGFAHQRGHLGVTEGLVRFGRDREPRQHVEHGLREAAVGHLVLEVAARPHEQQRPTQRGDLVDRPMAARDALPQLFVELEVRQRFVFDGVEDRFEAHVGSESPAP